ncbi:acetylcholine receptor subunit alpha-like 2 [Convolutriloba macropyga]|uniref:acetylcholine receptor subunit alpha-like 2 n=1 Tax=Convolutriloba macropyga TaxID=536237 RepID=UPI003F51DC4F
MLAMRVNNVNVLSILLLVVFCGKVMANGDVVLPGARLRSDLLRNYHTVVRPVIDSRKITYVKFKAWLYELVDINPKAQTINMLMFQGLEWEDDLLKWDPRNYSGVESIRFDRGEIWTPDILPFNEVGGFDEDKYDSIIPIEMNYNGQAWWMRPVDYETTCHLDVTNFPFDSQHCEGKPILPFSIGITF